ncbi:hypothetical protein AB5I41_15585 [Sphingomonas sp. MMS24-JH45]
MFTVRARTRQSRALAVAVTPACGGRHLAPRRRLQSSWGQDDRAAFLIAASAGFVACLPAVAGAQTVAELQRQIDELRAELAAMKRAQVAATSPPSRPRPSPPRRRLPRRYEWRPRPLPRPCSCPACREALVRARQSARLHPAALQRIPGRRPHRPRGHRAPAMSARFGDRGRRQFHLPSHPPRPPGRSVDRVSFYLQPDFATNANNQSVGEQRRGLPPAARRLCRRLRRPRRRRCASASASRRCPMAGKTCSRPRNRLTLDRSDAINSGVPSERDIGVIAYYTPPRVQRIWDRLEDDGQKLFGDPGRASPSARSTARGPTGLKPTTI